MIKKGSAAGGGFALGSLLGSKGTKFNGLDVKRVYFGYVVKPISHDSSFNFSILEEIGYVTTARLLILRPQEVASSSECWMNASRGRFS